MRLNRKIAKVDLLDCTYQIAMTRLIEAESNNGQDNYVRDAPGRCRAYPARSCIYKAIPAILATVCACHAAADRVVRRWRAMLELGL